MPKKVKSLIFKIFISILILWGSASFFLFPVIDFFNWLMLALSLISVFLLFTSRGRDFLFIIFNFSLIYSLNNLVYVGNLPQWVLIIGLALIIVTGYIYAEGSFFKQTSKSMIFSLFSNLFFGLFSERTNFVGGDYKLYLYFALFALGLVFFTISWGR
ncbi:MAG: hypothetical protein Athens101428_672 [Candidatus Berkelbacteria bacterium Athens1014_28]|uniref:Uncharacterized protein n=1 Tax=Candidatus Berkelbacteria bacterium Athens1014_28 TaxID=2017145 RepID=A0A554LLE4_9BACT|nr:MAG: hypothetical protein Athens101428_672 [Candidatus Berkelbacteria bacterium Athens1014_28]